MFGEEQWDAVWDLWPAALVSWGAVWGEQIRCGPPVLILHTALFLKNKPTEPQILRNLREGMARGGIEWIGLEETLINNENPTAG